MRLFRTLLLFLLSFVVVSTIHGQQKALWLKGTQTGLYDFSDGKRMAIHPNGNIYLVGEMGGSVDFGGLNLTAPSNTVFHDVFMACYSSDGALLWAKQILKSIQYSGNTVVDLKIDSQGDLVIIGWCVDQTSIAGSPTGNGSFIAKLDSSAGLKWAHFESDVSLQDYGSNLRGNKIVIDKDNNIIWYSDQNQEPSFSNYVGGLALIKYAPDGTKLFNKFFTQNSIYEHPQLASITMDSDGNFIVSGHFWGWINFRSTILYNNDFNWYLYTEQIFIAKLSSQGDLIWLIQSSGGHDSYCLSHTSDKAGNIYFAASIGQGVQFGRATSTFNFGQYLIKIDKDGNTLWVDPIKNGFFSDVIVSSDGNLYATGRYINNFQFQSFQKQTDYDQAFVLKLDTSGDLIGEFTSNSMYISNSQFVNDARAFQSLMDDQGNIYVMGDFEVGIKYGCLEAFTSGSSFFLVKVKAISLPEKQMKIYGPSVSCDNQSVLLKTDSIPGVKNYRWFLPNSVQMLSGPSQASTTSIIVKTTLQASGQTILVAADTCANFSDGAYVLNVKLPPRVPKIVLNKSQVCPGATELFSVASDTMASQFIWSSIPEIAIVPSITTDSARLNFADNFLQGNLLITSKNVCGDSSLTLSITTFPVPAKPILAGDTSICSTAKSIVHSIAAVNDAISHQWQIPAMTTLDPLYPVNTNTLHLQVPPSFIQGEIRVKALGQCIASEFSDALILSRVKKPGPASDLTGPVQLCTDDPVTTTFQVQAIENSSKYVWDIPGLFYPSGRIVNMKNSIQVNPMNSGTGSIKVYGLNTCGEKGDSITIVTNVYKLPPKPILEKGNCGRTLKVTNLQDPLWYFNDQLLPDAKGEEINVLDSGYYDVRMSNFCGTVSSDKIKIYPVKVENLFFSNVITANADGLNDFFIIDKSLENAAVQIIDRWGQNIYQTNNYQNNWNGGNVDAGTYYYHVTNECITAHKGWINLLR